MDTHLPPAVAIIGMSGVFPEAPTLEQFYQNLRDGRSSVRAIAQNRLADVNQNGSPDYLPCAFLDRVDQFDYEFFRLSAKEAELMDPSHRILLELACRAIENAGYGMNELAGSQTAVYLGGNPHSFYYELIEEPNPLTFTGNLHAMAAGRIAYLLNLCGPALMIDTACSSSLVAVHEACQKLLHDEVDYALVGGVNIINTFNETGKVDNPLGIISPDGISKTFDRDANGTGMGEGGGMLLLKRFDKAIADGDDIKAVIRGSAINQDGSRSNGMTAPSPVAQSWVIRKAWQKAGIPPESVTCIEAHGTGTKLGDPIEFKSIADVFGEYTPRRQFCAVSSVKTNIGHLNNAAGVAGLIKSVLALRHRQLFPSLHFQYPSPYIDFENTAAYVNTTLKEWETNQLPRRCGVSSFGLSGTNAHVVLEEYRPAANGHPRQSDEWLLLTISAKTTAALSQYGRDIAAYLNTTEQPIDRCLYTLNKGRDDYSYRWAVAAPDRDQLLRQLNNLIQQTEHAPQAVPEKGKAVVFLFSDAAYEPAAVDQLKTQSPIFRAAFDEVMRVVANYPTVSPEAVQTFAVQYALFRQLSAYGLTIRLVIGTGIGRLTKQVVTNALSLDEAVQTIGQYAANQTPLNEDRLRLVYQELTEQESLIFLDVGRVGSLSRALQAWPTASALTTALLDEQTGYVVLAKLAQLYQYGLAIDWNTFYAGKQKSYGRIEAPTYPFERTRCWPFEPRPVVHNQSPAWFHRLDWQPAPLPEPNDTGTPQTILLFCTASDDGETLAAALIQTNHRYIRVGSGTRFAETAPDVFQINPANERDYQMLAEVLTSQGRMPSGILIWNNASPVPDEAPEEQVQKSLYPPFYLTKAFDPVFSRQELFFWVLTRQARLVVQEDIPLNPAAAAVHGFMVSLKEEYPLLRIKCLDLDAETTESWSTLLRDELQASDNQYVVGYRKQVRYVPQVVPVFQLEGPRLSEMVQPGGTYLITGGTSGIGLEVARFMGQTAPIKLVVIGRTPFSQNDSWSTATDPTGRHQDAIQVFEQLEQLGCQVHYYAADLSDENQVATILTTVQQTIGPIRGVIHSAGVPGKKRIRSHALASFREGLAPKIQGTVHLYASLKTKPDFFILFSSLNALVGAERNTNYSAANLFLDHFVHTLTRQGIKAVSINWPGWSETGMLHRMNSNDAPERSESQLTTAEGLLALDWAIAMNQPSLLCTKQSPQLMGDNPYFLISPAYDLPDKIEPRNGKPTAIAHYPERQPLAGLSNARPGWSATEQTIAHIWSEILKKDTVELDDHFFKIGGHSINGAQVINRIEVAFDVKVEFETIFEFPTLNQLAQKVASLADQSSPQRHTAIEPVSVSPYYDVSFLQKQLWILTQFQEEQFAYNIRIAYELEGQLNRPAFDQAFACLLERHESLRTTFTVVDGELKQQVHSYDPTMHAVLFDDLRVIKDNEALGRQMADAEAQTVFDLRRGPLVRAKLIQLDSHRHLFLCTTHHIISDGRSMEILLSELKTLYNAFCNGQPNPLAPLRIQYKDFTAWQQGQLAGEALPKLQTYWLNQFQGDLPILQIPTDFPRPAVSTLKGNTVTFALSQALTEQVKALALREDMTLFMVLMASVNGLLYCYSGQTDIVLGTPVSGRDHRELEDQIGFYVNTLALRCQFDSAMSFRQMLQRVKETARGGYAHQAYPFIRLVEDIKLAYSTSRPQLFDVMVQMQAADSQEDDQLPGLAINSFRANHLASKFDLTFEFKDVQDEQTISVDIEYSYDLFLDATADNMRKDFLCLLEWLCTDGNRPLIDVKKQLVMNTHKIQMDYFADLMAEGINDEY